MRIGKVGGAEQATYELIRNLSLQDPNNHYRLESPRSTYFDWKFPVGFNHRVVFTDRIESERRVRRNELLNPEAKVHFTYESLDLLHAPSGYLPENVCSDKLIVTIHDLQHLVFPEYFTSEERTYREKQLAMIVATASRFICISAFTKSALMDHYQVSPKKISTIWMAPDPAMALPVPKRSRFEFLRAHGIPGPFLLYPSYPWVHKNHHRLLRAWDNLCRRQKIPSWKLVLTGAPFPKTHPAFSQLMKSIEKGHTVHLGYRSPREMRMLFQSAEMLIFPSEYEGFGLPVAEAFLAGLPVAASTAGSLPEIAGEAVLYFDPASESAIEDGLQRMVQDPRLRESLRGKGKERAQLFRADALARKTLVAYEETLSAPRAKNQREQASLDHSPRFEKFRHHARGSERAARDSTWFTMAWCAFAAAAYAPGQAIRRLGGGAACHIEVFLLRFLLKVLPKNNR